MKLVARDACIQRLPQPREHCLGFHISVRGPQDAQPSVTLQCCTTICHTLGGLAERRWCTGSVRAKQNLHGRVCGAVELCKRAMTLECGHAKLGQTCATSAACKRDEALILSRSLTMRASAARGAACLPACASILQ